MLSEKQHCGGEAKRAAVPLVHSQERCRAAVVVLQGPVVGQDLELDSDRLAAWDLDHRERGLVVICLEQEVLTARYP